MYKGRNYESRGRESFTAFLWWERRSDELRQGKNLELGNKDKPVIREGIGEK